MRFRFLMLFCLPVLLGACSKTSRPVQLDFVGSSTLTSGNKTVAANDTLTTRIYAVGNQDSLRRLRVEVAYSPGLSPINYPTPVSSFDPGNAPEGETIVYLDTLVKPIYTGSRPPDGGEYLFNNAFVARATSGTEQWQYTITDKKSETASRALRLTVRKADSAAVYHSYTALLRPVPRNRTANDAGLLRATRRVYLNLRTGLQLPKYAVVNNLATVQSNQLLVDLICTSTDGTSVRLSSPTDTVNVKLNDGQWPRSHRNATVLRATRLNETDFANTTTVVGINNAFTASTPFTSASSTGILAKNQVVAFQVTEKGTTHTGLLLVSNLVLGTTPVLTCSVKVTK
ncbi:hypothetical protein Q5H92_02390 [Hymenobacter sp. M29]|uniref:DUF1735 domain-containing protein n=1 Tax=Hymenobacter mellowenesis TaxID=3063995 RepID=A0ABT9A5T3_9BACT|nr:hypothetical protein [Hymenobacter sp. M29]MDO7845188.1 hypothetical protein [Hymenobacter sp. M29]